MRRGPVVLFVLGSALMRSASVSADTEVAVGTRVEARGVETALLAFAKRWEGTRYKYGGHGRGGIDCSAFVRRVYRSVFSVELPRTTRGQIEMGVEVRRGPILPGDLLFFVRKTGRPSHVAIYLGGGLFAHAEKGKGVVIEPFSALRRRRSMVRRIAEPSRSLRM